jgi:hypothetical protein
LSSLAPIAPRTYRHFVRKPATYLQAPKQDTWPARRQRFSCFEPQYAAPTYEQQQEDSSCPSDRIRRRCCCGDALLLLSALNSRNPSRSTVWDLIFKSVVQRSPPIKLCGSLPVQLCHRLALRLDTTQPFPPERCPWALLSPLHEEDRNQRGSLRVLVAL